MCLRMKNLFNVNNLLFQLTNYNYMTKHLTDDV